MYLADFTKHIVTLAFFSPYASKDGAGEHGQSSSELTLITWACLVFNNGVGELNERSIESDACLDSRDLW